MKESILRQIHRTIEQEHLLQPSQKVLVALSGGADSVALLLIMKELGWEVEALHCNFHLRGEESDRDEAFARSLCQEQDIPLFVQHFATTPYCQAHKVSIEMGARTLRYEWFEQMRKERNAQVVCVAHHQQDQAETVLLNLVRGTGIRGLAGMRYRNNGIVRPLLDIRKQDLEQYLRKRNQSWVTDSSNLERDALRNRMRLDVIPLLQDINPQVLNNIAQTAHHVQGVIPLYQRGLGETIASSTELHEWLLDCGFTPTQERNIWSAQTGAIIESPTHRLLKDRKKFVLQEKSVVSSVPHILSRSITRKEWEGRRADCAYFDESLVALPLSVRKVKEGDRFTPFGMKGSKLVSDLMTDQKLNRFEKEAQHVLCDMYGTILWVIGRRASDSCKVTDATQSILEVSVETPFTARYETKAYEEN